MAVTPVGQNRPQAPATFEATNALAQKSGAGEAARTLQPDNQVQAQMAQDTFQAAGANQAQAVQAPQDDFTNALSSLLQTLNQVVDMVKTMLPPETAQQPAPAQIAPGEPAPAPTGRADLNGMGGGARDTVDTNPLGLTGPGAQGTQQGAYGVPGINQNDPGLDGNKDPNYHFGQTNCAPTAMAELARGKSIYDPNYAITYKDANGTQQTTKVADMSNEQLVMALGSVGKTDGQGTSPNGVIDMAAALGEPVTNEEVHFDADFKEGQTGPSHSFDQKWLDDKIDGGEKVIVNGAYEGKDEKGKTVEVGHFMTIAGRNSNGTYAVMDPADGKQHNLTADQVGRFMQANTANGGVMLAIGKTAAENAAAQAAQAPAAQ